MTATTALRISVDPIENDCAERAVIEAKLALDDKDILELGCGRADLTRLIARGGPGRRVLALEVDEIQHAKNLMLTDLPNVQFKLAGAQAIPVATASMDVVFMFKSLHHVPLDAMQAALHEVARVLRPGGYAYLSEPIFAGAFNDILQIFHNEQRVRAAAFAAITAVVAGGALECVEQIFFNAPLHFPNFEAFDRQVIGVTHTRHVLTPATYAEVRARFAQHMGAGGVHLPQPLRVDLLRKPV
ncbi:MAG: class I SAM-dependent methyltransferase [Gammaproteobacteria bacterium]|nr:class I SAM-dependent methyltransferase [Gammaproteobacteria bacterium]